MNWFEDGITLITNALAKPMPHIDPIEVQLDIMVHRTQITERYPFTNVGSTT